MAALMVDQMAVQMAAQMAALMAAPTTIRSKLTESNRMAKQADLVTSRVQLRKTMEDHGLGYLSGAMLADWASGMASDSVSLEWFRKIDDVTHPDVAHNKTITAAAAVLTEIARSIDEGIEENAIMIDSVSKTFFYFLLLSILILF